MPSVHYFTKVRVRTVTRSNECQYPIEKRHAELVTVFQQQQPLEFQPLIVPSNEQRAASVDRFHFRLTLHFALATQGISLSGLTLKINMNT